MSAAWPESEYSAMPRMKGLLQNSSRIPRGDEEQSEYVNFEDQ